MRTLELSWPILLVALAGCGSSAAPPARQAQAAQCKPGEQKAEACNSCTCDDAGSWACTRRMCSACEPGHDQTCNDDPAVSSLWGRCEAGQCVCNAGFDVNPESGRCRPH